jgi:hypothetical protein
VKHPERFTFLSEELENRIPSARMLVYGDRRSNPTGRLPDDTWILRPQDLADCFTSQEDTWYFPRVAGTFKERAGFHGCQMPEQLLGRIVRCCSREGEIVLDPFSGSATTLAVAKKLGRRFLGSDLSADYVTRGTARLASIRVGDPLDGAPEPKMSAPSTIPVRGKQSQEAVQALLFASEASQQETLERAFVDGVKEAFRRVHDGFSVERVVADPELNAHYVDTCRSLGIASDPRSWNRALFELRKAGWLADIPIQKRTEFSWDECDPFLYASEIAWHQMFDNGWASLDEILLDPAAATEFDRRAAELAPGFSPLEYRWGALKLRKFAKVARMRAKLLLDSRFSRPWKLDRPRWDLFPASAGVYLVSVRGQKTPLYAGQSLQLRDRLQRQFGEDTNAQHTVWPSGLTVRFFRARPSTPLLIAYQAGAIRKYSPRLNLAELKGH